MTLRSEQFNNWTDDQLCDYERDLYDREVAGDDVWIIRDSVLWEMNRRGLCGGHGELTREETKP